MEKSSAEKVCQFLEQRGVSSSVIETFRQEKMDKSAIENSSDATLEEMGLTKMGDKLSLRGFCKQSSDNETTDHKRGLLEAFLNVKRKKSSSKTPVKDVTCAVNPKEDKKKTNKIQLGWLHFDEKKQKFISVRLMKGGGTRDVDIYTSYCYKR